MSKRLKSIALAVSAGAWLFLLPCAEATTVVPPTFAEMADKSDLVFLGQVVDSRAEWRSVGTNRVIFTLVRFKTQEVLKGNAGASVTLHFLGGTVGDVTLRVAEVPTFSAGDRLLLFVEGNGVQFCPLVGIYHGKFRLQMDEKSGREIVLMHDGRPLRDVEEIGVDADADLGPKRAGISIPADREPLSVDDFKERIRSHLANKTK